MRAVTLLVAMVSLTLGCWDASSPGADAAADAGPVDARDAAADAAADAGPVDARDAGGDAAESTPYQLTRTQLGAPTWRVQGIEIFSAGCATVDEAREYVLAIIPDHQLFQAQEFFGPRVAHAGPYGDEITQGVLRAGYPRGPVLPITAALEPRCVFMIFALVPTADAPTGSSVDFESGPILDPAGLPIVVTGKLSRAGSVIDQDFGATIPAPSVLSPVVTGDGYSHVIVSFADNDRWGPDFMDGEYAYEATAVDTRGNGWRVQVPFTLETAPCYDFEEFFGASTCPAEQVCEFLPYLGCRDVGTHAVDEACTSNAECPAHTTCWRGRLTGELSCRPICDNLHPCGPGERCSTAYVLNDQPLGACDTAQACDMLSSEGCPQPGGCYADPNGGEYAEPYCALTGSGTPGAPCQIPHDCVPGATCYSVDGAARLCRAWCTGDDDCVAPATCQGIGTLLPGVDYGLCL